jgi:hypothetical protein
MPEAIDRDVVERLLIAGAPERCVELHNLWSQYEPTFYINPDCAAVVFKARKDRIDFTHQTLRHDWLLAFASWKAFLAYSPVILLAVCTGQTLTPDLLNQDEGLADAETRWEELVYTARMLRQAPSVDEVAWPAAVPEPIADGSNLPQQDRAAFDLLCIASTALFVHELRHIRFAQDGNRPEVWREEETACDAAAREFLLDRADASVLCKRTMGLALAAYILHEQTPAGGLAGSEHHPSSADRFEELVGKALTPDDADCWIFASALLIAVLRRARRFTSPVTCGSPKELCSNLITMLREANP